MTVKNKFLLIMTAIFVLSGCDKTPMEKLASNTVYPDLNDAFWGKEQNKHTALWQQAESYCYVHTEKPNCPTVNLTSIISHGNTQIIPFGK